MSFVKKSRAMPVNSEFQIELVPNPAIKFSEETKLKQQNVIEGLTKVSRGLFLPNPAVKVQDGIKSGQLYNRGLSVSKLSDAMQKHNLVMRVSVSGEHNACAMATHEDLASNAVISSPSGSFSLGVSGNHLRHIDFL